MAHQSIDDHARRIVSSLSSVGGSPVGRPSECRASARSGTSLGVPSLPWRFLLSRFAAPDGRWGPPGGGVGHGEHPADGVVREVWEETGYDVRVVSLLGVHSSVWHGLDAEVHATHLVYEVAEVGGALRHEVGGSSDQAAWVSLTSLPDLRRTALLEVALDLYRRRPQDGRSEPA